eukprot:TRINITY_DN23390_c0_g1_i2.p1 TRINITY_DN23390_c0_g1~~TRINITY_DN23390_c0_g1_i2.p1  ORF type:complete len:606 (+),score=70.87 TRINITY_DN23390_c0_g1_i2:129-1946(+)
METDAPYKLLEDPSQRHTLTGKDGTATLWPSARRQSSYNSNSGQFDPSTAGDGMSSHGDSPMSSYGEEAAQKYIIMTRSMSRTRSKPEILRSVDVRAILGNFGKIFTTPGAKSGPFQKTKSRDFSDDHDAADRSFYAARQSSVVDVFISHVWTARRVEKYLAVLYYINVAKAVKCAVATWLLSLLLLLHQQNWQITTFGGKEWGLPLTVRLVFIPISVFYFVFFFGHTVPSGFERRSFWLDKLCIHQTRSELKLHGVAALPEFVASAKRLLLLWSDTYFERLWCNCEIATFCAVNGNADAIDFQPLWLAPWVLVTISMDLVSIVLLAITTALVPLMGQVWSEVFGAHTSAQIFFSQLTGIGFCMGLSYMPAAFPNYFSFCTKLDSHADMLSQLHSYRLEDAKCTVDSDRQAVQKHIQLLFGACPTLAADPSDGSMNSPLDRFNRYMQNDVRDCCSAKLGLATRLPYKHSQLVFLPLIFESVANVLNCDGFDCVSGAEAEGYTSAYAFMATNATNWLIGISLVYPTTYSLMLICIDYVRPRLGERLRSVVCIACIVVIYFLMGFMEGFVGGCTVNIVNSGTPFWWAVGLSYLAFLLWLNRTLFMPR